jgi:ABC-type multidrug transport system fused ATPase/permease subunit
MVENPTLRMVYIVLLMSLIYCGISLSMAYTLPITMGAAFVWPLILIIGVIVTFVGPILSCIHFYRLTSEERARIFRKMTSCYDQEQSNDEFFWFGACQSWISYWTIILCTILFLRIRGENETTVGDFESSIRNVQGSTLFLSFFCGILATMLGTMFCYAILYVLGALILFCIDSYRKQQEQMLERMRGNNNSTA